MIPRLEIHFSLKQQKSFFVGRKYQQKENEFLLNHARSGIVLALRSIQLKPGSKIGVMVYNCHTVFDAIAQAGFDIVFIDVTSNLIIDINDLRCKSRYISALVVTHLFGIENDITRLKAEFPNLVIIEDCAHAFGKVHNDGDFSVYSVGQGKLPSLGPGGLLFVNNSTYLPQISYYYSQLRSYQFYETIFLFFSMLVKSVLYNPIVYTHITKYLKKNKRSNLSTGIKVTKMSKGIQRMLLEAQADFSLCINRRLQRARELEVSIVGTYGIERCIIGTNAFMLVVLSNNVSSLKDYFRRNGIESETHFRDCLRWAREYGYENGYCPNAERLINQLLMVPTYK